MSKTHETKSRYGDVRKFTVNDDKIILEGETKYTRFALSENEETIEMIDLDGGPYVVVGMDLEMLGIPMVGTINYLKVLDNDKEHYLMAEIGYSEKQ